MVDRERGAQRSRRDESVTEETVRSLAPLPVKTTTGAVVVAAAHSNEIVAALLLTHIVIGPGFEIVQRNIR